GDVGAAYTIKAQNTGAGPTSGTVTITDTLPAGLTPTAVDGSTVNGWTLHRTGQTVTATRSDVLAAGNFYSDLPIVVNVAPTAPANSTTTASISGGGDADNTNNSASDPTPIAQLPDLTIAKSHTGNFTQGQTNAAYSIVVSNGGGAATSGTVTVTDVLPAG